MAGRRPKPTKLKILQGTFRPCRGNPSEPQPELGTPEAPAYLKGEALAEWTYQTAHLSKTRVLALQDRALLAAFCAIHGRVVEMFESGADVKAALITQYRLLGEAFGLSPASRARLHAGKPEDKKNEWHDLLKRKA